MKRMWSKNELKSIIQNLASSGDLKNVKVFEHIVDKDGHPRFIEGDITITEQTGITKTYGKWSLSGSHLLIVVSMDMLTDSGGTWVGAWGSMDLPQWIKDKIVPNSAYSETLIDYKGFDAFADDSTTQIVNVALRKEKGENGGVYMSLNAPTLTKDRSVRIAFDLLIDNE